MPAYLKLKYEAFDVFKKDKKCIATAKLIQVFPKK